MRTFPKSLAAFRKLIEERGAELRKLAIEDLRRLAGKPVEHTTFDSRPATIGIMVQTVQDGSLRVVVRGFMRARFLPGWNVALDGFYKHPDGTLSEMPGDELNRFD